MPEVAVAEHRDPVPGQKFGGSNCTAGPAVSLSGYHFLLTARHCAITANTNGIISQRLVGAADKTCSRYTNVGGSGRKCTYAMEITRIQNINANLGTVIFNGSN